MWSPYCKVLLDQHVEALREYYRAQLIAVRNDQLITGNKDPSKYAKIVNAFEKEKKKIREEQKAKQMDQETFKNHIISIARLHTDTDRLTTRLKDLQQFQSIQKAQEEPPSPPAIENIQKEDQHEVHQKREVLVHQHNGVEQQEELKEQTFVTQSSSVDESIPDEIAVRSAKSTLDEQHQVCKEQHEEKVRSVSFTEEQSQEDTSPRQNTSADEIESIPEEVTTVNTTFSHGTLLDEIVSSTNPDQSELEEQHQGSKEQHEEEKVRSVSFTEQSQEDTSPRQNTSADEIESIPEEIDTAKSMDTTLDEDLASPAFKFKPSEKSLQSILSSIQNSVSTGRDSMGRRRSSASEALLKLRLMNNVPSMPLPPLSPVDKSPPKTPRSPLGLERFMAKYPQQSKSRETSFTEEFPAELAENQESTVELLDELPDTNQLGMLLDLSQSPGILSARTSVRASCSDENIQPDKFTKQRKLVEKYAGVLWMEFTRKGPSFDGDYPISDVESEHSFTENGTMSRLMLRQLCCETLLNLIQTAHCSAISQRALSSEKGMTDYMIQEILAPLIDPQKQAVTVSNGIKSRAEKTSHVLMESNRLLLAKHIYETKGVWPNSELQKEINHHIKEKENI